MIVVADTSPLNYLIQMEQIEILQTLYGRILIPHAVHAELLDRQAPRQVNVWAQDPPAWLEILSPSKVPSQLEAALDTGEAEAIALAEEFRADWLLIDEADGREEAARRGLQPIGTLGVLRNAHRKGFLDFKVEARRLQDLGFFVSDDLIKQVADSLE